MKKLVIVLLVFVLLLTVACSKKEEPSASPGKEGSTDAKEVTTLKVGASPVPHAEILQAVVEDLAKEGVKLEIVEFDDYVIPNTSLEEGALDANFFQHVPYLENFNEERKTHLAAVANVHIEPIAIYSAKIKSLDELKEGGEVAIPGDATNGGRALLLFQNNGLIKLKDGVGLTATVQDIVENPKNLKFRELEAAQIPRALEDVDVAAINTNYALAADLSPKDALAVEEGVNNPYANVLVVKEGNEENEAVQKLVKALQSETVKKFIEEKYQGAVIPAF